MAARKPPELQPRICSDIHGLLLNSRSKSVFIRVNPWPMYYGTETTDTDALAITGALASGVAESMRITWPAWGGCIPYCRANRSMRSGEGSDASSSRGVGFSSE